MAQTTNFMEKENIIERPLDVNEPETVAAFIAQQASGIYAGKNVDGERVIIMLDNQRGMDILTHQANGWIRKNYFDKDGFSEGETFEGRYTI